MEVRLCLHQRQCHVKAYDDCVQYDTHLCVRMYVCVYVCVFRYERALARQEKELQAAADEQAERYTCYSTIMGDTQVCLHIHRETICKCTLLAKAHDLSLIHI